ncbi:hypothetical protein RJ641_005481 [Dillenia turbinata]|uniref:Membrane-associated kinase regulator 4 n=1 Tax=Dillenia turbinata TaxID=194707 RepID=A0AAN8VG84_9MAGN
MAANTHLNDHADDDYIDMEVSTFSNFLYHSMSSPQHTREFEFQMSSSSLERDTTTSPADELFYKGKLLPLHLPPRLQMVEKLLNSSSANESKIDDFEEFYGTPMATTTTPTPATGTPFESCNISPSESCRVSRELNPNEYFLECGTDINSFIGDNPKRSWTRKLKLIKQSSLSSKLKASRAYLKSLFRKSSCSDESGTAATRNVEDISVSKAKESLNKYTKVAKKNPFEQIKQERDQMSKPRMRSFDKDLIADGGSNCHRKSFSGIIKRHSTTKSSSSSSFSSSSTSNSSNGFSEYHFLKRSSSSSSDIESAIQSAIAHCKRSQQIFCSRKTASEVGFCSLPASMIAVCEDQERPGLCRG